MDSFQRVGSKEPSLMGVWQGLCYRGKGTLYFGVNPRGIFTHIGESKMLVESFPAPMYATNCWVIATGVGAECIIIDPGMPDISHDIEEIISRNKLKPIASFLTHGHLDHTFSIKPLADGYGISAFIHSEDRQAISNPALLHGAEFGANFIEGNQFAEPISVENLKNGDVLDFVGMQIKAIHSPGHTPGSIMFVINDELLVSGDVLFAGSIGRTDTPLGSMDAMRKTLKNKVLPLDDALRVLPGHGPETSIKFERANNPYLKELRS
jgi:glyoxylase-like metal-dependent hydrolase (beta-lactamase superfamily II)